MIVFTDGSAQSSPDPTGSGVIIKKQRRNSTPIKIAKTVKYMGSSYEGELEAIKIVRIYKRQHFSLKWLSTYIFRLSVSNISCYF